MNTKMTLIGIGTVAVAIISLATSISTTIRQRNYIRKLKKSLGDIEEMGEEKITETLIEKAVNRSAEKKVEKYLDNVDNDVLKLSDRELRKAAQEAVDKYSNDIRKKAAAETAKQVADLDIEELKDRVCHEAEKHVMEKLDNCMDTYAKKFEHQMDQNKKLCDKIARNALERNLEDNNLHVVLL